MGHSGKEKEDTDWEGQRESDYSHESRHINEVPNSDLQYCMRNLLSVSMFSQSSVRAHTLRPLSVSV